MDIEAKCGTVSRKTLTVKPNDDLFLLSGKRELYEGYQIAGIDCTPGFESIEFSNTETVMLGKAIGAIDENIIKEAQIKRTIRAHLDKELRFRDKGIKVLSLFFIDEVKKYRLPDGTKGIYAEMFERCYNELINKPKYESLKQDFPHSAETIHNGYFSQDKKPDMLVADLDAQNIFNADGKLDRANILNDGMKNVGEKNNPKNNSESSFVYVPDIKRDIKVTRDGLRHSLTRNAEATAIVTKKIGDVLENAIKVNELTPRKNTVGGYVLLGIGQDADGNLYPTRIVVNNYNVDEVEVLDVLYAVNTKRRTSPQTRQGIAGNSAPLIKGSSKISIADLLDIVKNDFSDVFSDDVLNELSVQRKSSNLSGSIKYSKDIADIDSKSRWTTKRVENVENGESGFSKVVKDVKDKPSYYQIHDEAFYNSVAELSPQQTAGLLRIMNSVMQPMKLLITQNNPIFAATNALRDFGTAYKLSEINNPVAFTLQYMSALKEIIANSEDYKQYKAMGGGHSSELSANIDNISNTLRKVAQKDMGMARRLAYSIFLHPVETVASLNDAIESVPRFMEFQRTLNAGGDLQEAIYNASDITTNHKRSGKGETAKAFNKLIMFNNAAIQGVDKMLRTLTDKDEKRRHSILLKWLLQALIMGAIGYAYNKMVDEEGYKNLSSYKKNNFYNYAIGDGKFISLPKPRENALLDSVTERTIEYVFGNKEAYYDFGSYVGSQILPPMLPDKINPVDATHSVLGSTIFGGLIDVGFNKDFKGTPIESAYDKYTPSNERYTDTTSKTAYALGQTKFARELDLSPKKIDHLISSYTGILGQVNKAIAPMNENRRDLSFGLRNKFISDSNYSTDVLNRMYENEEKAERAFNYNGTAKTAVEYERNAIITSYISGMNKAVKALPAEEQRKGRAYLLKTLNDWNYNDTTSQKNMLNRLDGAKVTKDSIFIEMPSSTLEWTIDKQKYVYQMTPYEYYDYISKYLVAIENARKKYGGNTIESYEQAKDAAKKVMSEYKKKTLKNKYFDKAVKNN